VLGRRGFTVGLIAVVGLAAFLRFWGLGFGLPHLLTRPDEFPILEHTVLAAEGVFEYEWSVYPPAYLYLHWIWGEFWLAFQSIFGIAEGSDYAAIWKSDPSRIYRVQRGLSAASGCASVLFVGVATARRLGHVAGLGAAFWLAVCFLHARDSHAVKPDALLSLIASMAIVASAALAREPTIRRGLAAGVAVGAAGAAKYNGVVAALPVCVAAWASAWRTGVRGVGVLFPRPLLAAGGMAAFFFVATSPFLLFNEAAIQMLDDTLRAVFPQAFDSLSETGADRFEFLVGPTPPEWATQYGRLGTLWYHAAFSLNHGTGLLATCLALPAVVWGLFSREWLLRSASVFVLGWFVSVAASPVMLARYMTPLLPALAILESALLVALVGALAARFPAFRSGRLRAACFAALIGLVGAQPLVSAVSHEQLLRRDDTRELATRWLAANTPRGSRISVVGTHLIPWGAPRLPWGRVPVLHRTAQNVRTQRVDYVVTHDHELFWSTPDPGWMRRNERWLVEVADFDPREGALGVPTFEVNDAYYVPIAGFSGVTRPGPRVRVYRVQKGPQIKRK